MYSGKIHGTVTDRVDGSPLIGARVYAYLRHIDTPIKVAHTAISGEFVLLLNDIEDDTLRLRAEYIGYVGLETTETLETHGVQRPTPLSLLSLGDYSRVMVLPEPPQTPEGALDYVTPPELKIMIARGIIAKRNDVNARKGWSDEEKFLNALLHTVDMVLADNGEKEDA